MNNVEEGVEFLPAMNSKKMEKRGPKRRVVVAIMIVAFLLISLIIGLLVWHFKCECEVQPTPRGWVGACPRSISLLLWARGSFVTVRCSHGTLAAVTARASRKQGARFCFF